MTSPELASAVYRHLARVRENPAAAVAPEELEELEREARNAMDGTRLALTAPSADRTMLSRVVLLAASTSAVVDDFPNVGEPIRIVGFNPTIIALEDGKVLPPTWAIDVRITTGRAQKEIYTNAQNLQNAAAPLVPQSQFVPLSSIDAAIANRLMDFVLDRQPVAIEFAYQWAVDQTTRTALNWSNVQISVAWFVKDLEGAPRR